MVAAELRQDEAHEGTFIASFSHGDDWWQVGLILAFDVVLTDVGVTLMDVTLVDVTLVDVTLVDEVEVVFTLDLAVVLM